MDHQVEEVEVDQDAVRPEEAEDVGVDSRRSNPKAESRQTTDKYTSQSSISSLSI